MRCIADLHIHSRYSRACSPNLTPENISYWAQIKGIDVVATGDFTHPAWFSILKEKLQPLGNGLYSLKKDENVTERQIIDLPRVNVLETKFIFSTEVSCIYSQGGRVRRLHLCIVAPNLEVAEKINQALEKLGAKLKSDGRPILGLSAKRLVEIVLLASPDCLVIPAHIWTPWFSVFGSKSGFDSLAECFEELTSHIYAVETGLSSDPEMNWLVPELDHLALLSNSDAHSPSNLGREANIFDLEEISYGSLVKAIKTKKGLVKTIEFFPEEGMYHFDGHRACGISLHPAETKKLTDNLCPVCHRPVTIGVLSRVCQLAKYPEGRKPASAVDFYRLIGLDDIIAEALVVKNRKAKKVISLYKSMIELGGSEFDILLNVEQNFFKNLVDEKIIEGLKRNRAGELFIQPGFDGQYGKINLFSILEKKLKKEQGVLL